MKKPGHCVRVFYFTFQSTFLSCQFGKTSPRLSANYTFKDTNTDKPPERSLSL
jgi:hypothetical protein